MGLHDEIFEQPEVIRRLLRGQRSQVQEAARLIRRHGIRYAFLAARGTSDNAGRYAGYLWGAHNSLAVALALPSLFTYYGTPPSLANSLVVSISQSGKSPDIISVLQEGRRQGVPTMAITNAPDSPLAKAADLVIDIMAGEEKAVAASKTYTAQLMAVAMISAALETDRPERWDDLEQAPEWMEAVLKLDDDLAIQAQRYRYMEQCVVIGRGFNYATAFEWSLKLKELTYTIADPYSSADFLHGPLALVTRGFPVLAVAPSGAVFETVRDLLVKLRDQFHAELVVISDEPEVLQFAQTPIPLPAGIPEWISPLITILPAQMFVYHLTRARGYSTETPRSIHKVTETN